MTNRRPNSRSTSRPTPAQKPNGTRPAPPVETPGKQPEDRLRQFLTSLGDVLKDFTALEVNTMVVSQITGNKFNPFEAYRHLYFLQEPFFEESQVPEELRQRYRSLHEKLVIEYGSWISHGQTQDLPNPDDPRDAERLEAAFYNAQFLRSLRKLKELKAVIDLQFQEYQATPNSRAKSLFTVDFEDELAKNDMIYAQTVIQLDGDVINRYHEKVFDHEHRDVILQIHNEGVMAGEKQWRGLLGFMVDLLHNLVGGGRRSTEKRLPWNS